MKCKKAPSINTDFPDNNPIKDYRNELIARLLANKCELCNTIYETENISVHHVRKLKDLKEKYENKRKKPYWVTKMIKMNRRTLIVCNSCHNKIHK